MCRKRNERMENYTYCLLSLVPGLCLPKRGWGKNTVVFQCINFKMLREDFCPLICDGAMNRSLDSLSGRCS